LKNVEIEKMGEVLDFLSENFSNIEYLYYDEESSQNDENEIKEEKESENDEEMYYAFRKKPKKAIELENEANLIVKKINCTIFLPKIS